MADPRSSRRAAFPSGYGDVFGGPPKYSSAPFSAKPGDYGEIFGGMANCSIPFLDLPTQTDGCDESVDYSEIFGGFGGGDFAVDYEELFGKKKTKKKENEVEASCSNGRIPKETMFGGQRKDSSDICGESLFGEKNHFPTNSEYSDDGSRQFSMSFHKISHRRIEDASSSTTHVTELHAVPGYTSMIDSCSPFMQSDNPTNVSKNGHIRSLSSEGRLTDEEQVNVVPPAIPADCTKNSVADLKSQQKQFTYTCPVPEDTSVNVRHHSCSSSNRSSSSGDVSFHDVSYVTISDISLRTQPSRVPPPSRAPPKLDTKQGLPKMKRYGSFGTDLEEGSLPKTTGNRQTHYSLGVPKNHLINKGLKDGSPSFLNVEVDAKSAAAASAAAMKEAMEQAQARLKSAKEIMERKRENLRSRKKMGEQEVMKCDERPEYKAAKDAKCYTEVKTQRTLLEENGSMKGISFKEGEIAMTTAKAAPTEEKERYVVSSEEDQELMQQKGFKTLSVPYKLEEISGEWKTDKEFYELVKSDNNSKIVKEVYKQEALENNQEVATTVNEYKENYTSQADLSCDVEMCGKSPKVKETSDRRENDEKFTFVNMALYDKIREIPNTILKACMGKENVNKLPEVHDSLHRMKNENNLDAVQDVHVSEDGLERLNAIEGTVEGDYASQESQRSDETFDTSFSGVTHVEEKESERETTEEPRGCDNDEKELSGASVSLVTLETEKRQNVGGAVWTKSGNETERASQSQSCMLEMLEQLDTDDGANQCESRQKPNEDGNPEYNHEENGYEFETTTAALEEEIRRLDSTTEAGICLQQSQVVEDTDQVEADLEKHEAVEGMLGHSGSEKNNEVGLQDSEEIKSGEAQKDDEKQQKAARPLWEQENCEEAMISEGTKRRDTEKVGEVYMSFDLEEMHKRSDAARGTCETSVDKDPEVIQQPSLLEKKGNIHSSVHDDVELHPMKLQSLARDNIGSCQVNSQRLVQECTESHHSVLIDNAILDMHKWEKKENVGSYEKEKDQEQEKARKFEEERARNLEEEKEREREREKDRLAVERATREARERTLSEARERAERIAVERVTAEARQRALAEVREKAEKASAEALEKSLAEKASKEAKLRAERAAVERATAEARERAVEKALAEKAASDARQRAERLNAASRDSRATGREDRDTKLNPGFMGMQHVPNDARFQSATSSSSLKKTNSYIHGDGDSPLRCKARLERHQRTVERAAKALAEKNMRDILAQREQAERNRLSDSLDADVRRWSSGKEGNLRALLSTLQYILGPESGWQPIPLTDVITAVAVKKAYRKATLCVHPDKLQQRGASIQQKYICEKVFDLLKDAWNRFNSEER